MAYSRKMTGSNKQIKRRWRQWEMRYYGMTVKMHKPAAILKTPKPILILEDNDVAVEALLNIIDDIDQNAKTVVFKSTPDTIAFIIKEDFDLFIVDIVLERKNPNDASVWTSSA